ncbi:MAG: von Willebrand factor type A domain-containing protein, partial [Gammaproteobacteria bacterium]
MKNQFISLCFTFVLVVFAGCSQPVSQDSAGTGNTGSIKNPQTPAVSVEDENTHTMIYPHDPVQHQVRTEQDLATGPAAAPGKIEDMQGQVLQRMMPEMATAMPYDHGWMPHINPASIDRENYAHFDDNPVKRVSEQPVSTFSIDVDTGSYAVVRRMLNNGQMPRHDAVRSEELINYFSYDYPERAEASAPFALHKEIAPTPWNQDTYLLHIGINGFEQERSTLPPANLVFLVDVSGSMQDANKLE